MATPRCELRRARAGEASAAPPTRAWLRKLGALPVTFRPHIVYGPVSSPGVPALERRRIGHAGRTYLRAAGYTAANPHLIAQQASIGFARALGAGWSPRSTAGGSSSPSRP